MIRLVVHNHIIVFVYVNWCVWGNSCFWVIPSSSCKNYLLVRRFTASYLIGKGIEHGRGCVDAKCVSAFLQLFCNLTPDNHCSIDSQLARSSHPGIASDSSVCFARNQWGYTASLSSSISCGADWTMTIPWWLVLAAQSTIKESWESMELWLSGVKLQNNSRKQILKTPRRVYHLIIVTGVEHSRNSLLDPKKSKNYIYYIYI